MKISKSKLRQLIKEELNNLVTERETLEEQLVFKDPALAGAFKDLFKYWQWLGRRLDGLEKNIENVVRTIAKED